MTGAPVTMDQLGRWAGLADDAGDNAQEAAALARCGRTTEAAGLADAAKDSARRLGELLHLAGAEIPGKPVADVPLHLLDTPATRRLLGLLVDAQEAAEAVDRERGHVLPAEVELLPGESRGTGWAETISCLAERLRVEVHGPQGSGRE